MAILGAAPGPLAVDEHNIIKSGCPACVLLEQCFWTKKKVVLVKKKKLNGRPTLNRKCLEFFTFFSLPKTLPHWAEKLTKYNPQEILAAYRLNEPLKVWSSR